MAEKVPERLIASDAATARPAHVRLNTRISFLRPPFCRVPLARLSPTSMHYCSPKSERKIIAAARSACGCVLKVDHGGSSHSGWNRHAAIGDRVLARNRELIDATIDLPLRTDGAIQGCRVQVDLCGLSCGGRGRTKWSLALSKCPSDGCCDGNGIAVRVNAHVVSCWIGAQQVIVKRGDADAAR